MQHYLNFRSNITGPMHGKYYINNHSVIGGTLSKEKFSKSGKIYQSVKCQVTVYYWRYSESGRAVGKSLLSLPIFPWVQKRVGFLLNYPISFLDFSGACALLQSNPFPRFSQANLLPLYDITLVLKAHASQLCFSFVFYCSCTQWKEFHLAVFSLPLLIQQNSASYLQSD